MHELDLKIQSRFLDHTDLTFFEELTKGLNL